MLGGGRRQPGVETLLKLREVVVKLHHFGSERMDGTKMLRAAYACVVVGPAGFSQRHLRGVVVEDATISSYHPGWYLLANSVVTSPRITEPNAPRSAKTPI